MRSHRLRAFGFVALWCVLLQFGAAAPALSAQVVDSAGGVKPLLVYDRDFAADSSLIADSGQTIVFTSDARDSVGRFRLERGRHDFCVTGGAGSFTYLVLERERGATLTRRLDARGCARVQVRAGVVSVRLRQTGSRTPPPAWATAAIRVDAPEPPIAPVALVDGTNSPVGGYWAIQDTTYNAHGTFGNRVLSTTPGPDSGLLVDPSTAWDARSLFQLPPISGQQLPAIPESVGDVWSLYFYLPYVVNPCGFYCGNAYGPPPGIQIHDNGNYEFVFDLERGQTDGDVNLEGNNETPNHLIANLQGSLAGDSFQVVFRFYPDGT